MRYNQQAWIGHRLLTELPQEMLEMTHLHYAPYKPTKSLVSPPIRCIFASGPQHTLCPKHQGVTNYDIARE